MSAIAEFPVLEGSMEKSQLQAVKIEIDRTFHVRTTARAHNCDRRRTDRINPNTHSPDVVIDVAVCSTKE
jgi:hypothetical protein